MKRMFLFFLFYGFVSLTIMSGEVGSNIHEIMPTSIISTSEKLFYPTQDTYRDFNYQTIIIGVDIAPVNGSGSTCHVPFATQLAAFFKNWGCFSKGSVTVLKGSQATKQQIKKTIINLHLGPKDVLIIYYGGHGDLQGIISGDRINKKISPAELSEWTEQSGAGFKVLLVSACYSGIFARHEEIGSGFQRPGFAVITNGEEGGTSTYTSEGIGFGPYLWKLLNMKQEKGNKVITLGEFKNFIKQENEYWEKEDARLRQEGSTEQNHYRDESDAHRLNNGRNFGPEDLVIFWN
ncbi:MAG: hypothetical protein L6420_11620 [Elusimicrobia bacterium]|nr:hypothetical protein [Elusimicrobiota bacterium]